VHNSKDFDLLLQDVVENEVLPELVKRENANPGRIPGLTHARLAGQKGSSLGHRAGEFRGWPSLLLQIINVMFNVLDGLGTKPNRTPHEALARRLNLFQETIISTNPSPTRAQGLFEETVDAVSFGSSLVAAEQIPEVFAWRAVAV
jgi:hypothetical protein